MPMDHSSRNSERIALFDVCRTLVSVTTITSFAEEFLLNSVENQKASRVCAATHGLFRLGRRLGFVSGHRYTKHLVSLFKGYSEEDLVRTAERYTDYLYAHLNESVYARLLEHRKAGDHVYLVSAGLDVYLKPFAQRLGVGLVCSALSKDADGRYDGLLAGPYCTGEQKWVEVEHRVLKGLNYDLEGSSAYGDSYSDTAVLSRVGNPVAVNPDSKLRMHAVDASWEILEVNRSRESIAFLINDLKRAGAQRVFVDDANHLRALGYRVTVIALMNKGALELELNGSVLAVRARSPLDFNALYRIRRILLKERTNVLVSTLNEANVSARLVALTLPRLSLFTREANTANRKTFMYKLLDITLSWRSTRIIAVSHAVAQSLASYMPWNRSRIHVLYNGFDIPSVQSEENRSGILCVASLTKKKDIQVLIRAMVFLPYTLTLIGDGPERDSLKELAELIGVADRVVFFGEAASDVIAAAYARHAVFVLPSLHEGCPNVALEAKAYGLPVVAFAIPGMDEFVSSASGCLVADRIPESLARAIREAYESHEEKGRAAVQEAGLMSRVRHTEELLSILQL